MTNDEQIGYHLKRLRGQISPKTFASMFPISRTHYLNIEAGRKTLQDDMVDVLVKKFPDLPLSGESDLACILKLKDYPIKKMMAWHFKRKTKQPQDNEKINPDYIIEITDEDILFGMAYDMNKTYWGMK